MTEKEKMLAGEAYNCGDEELLDRWHKAKALLKAYNNTDTTNTDELNKLLSELLGSKGKNVWIAQPFFCDYGENIHIGENTEINHNCVFLDCNRISIGNHVLIAPAVQLYTAYHPVRAAERLQKSKDNNSMLFCISKSAPITIGNNVWIGGGSIILPGITIGNNVTIGAGSVVTTDLPENVLAVGNPCRIVRKLEP